MTEEQKTELYEQVMKGELQQDIVVLEDMHVVPCMNREYHTNCFYIGMCRRGHAKSRYDYHDFDFSAGEICWLQPDHVLSHSYVSDDYKMLSVFVSKSCFMRLKQMGMLGKYRFLLSLVTMKLSPEIFDFMYNAFVLLGKLMSFDNPRNPEMVTSLLNIIVQVCDHYIETHVPEVASGQLLHEELFERFYDAIIEHYRESREVSFYARLLCRSPKYFATIIKQTTGIAALDWINTYVIIKAKGLLLHDKQKSIQQIALELGFTEQASFARLFKRITGSTPTEFRAQNWSPE